MEVYRRRHSFSSTLDTFSESWCSVHLSPQQPAFPLPPSEPPQQRVATWLQQQHIEAMQPAQYASSCRKSQSQVSLADFLRCTGPQRPSFLDRTKPKQTAPDTTASPPAPDSKQHPRAAEEEEPTDAEFLSHVLSHFVAFQPQDFPQIALAACDQPATPTDGLWTLISRALGELTRDITFLN
ncbi:hypothetical protein IWW39_001390 [Coemansia spiralis]|uniref:Uncharacterized protein n=1 Tax=Coemansia spiralis TaxID=417178 RepID=A0A9W8L4I7_9FUNG|nr:hypothetical protein IWW39_001390 [Coemansia spiralis]